jgi:hypothetical protein
VSGLPAFKDLLTNTPHIHVYRPAASGHRPVADGDPIPWTRPQESYDLRPGPTDEQYGDYRFPDNFVEGIGRAADPFRPASASPVSPFRAIIDLWLRCRSGGYTNVYIQVNDYLLLVTEAGVVAADDIFSPIS